ncbi:MAG: 16S rRNA (cytidine(1402)-2'-O)-methyltransferase [Oscillospiraceae bacterium]|nr:16S rRNA (cytidine(1402)-2'-O)-methyltransferase [Oscillospiraceae bacterium]
MSNGLGKLSVVGTPIGNLSDFSPRGIEALEKADYIAAEDTRVTLRLLTHFGIRKPLLSYYKPHEAEKSAKILELLCEGKNVALVSDAGMPCISDPGVLLVQRCGEMGIGVEVIPGCNAAIAAVAVSGIDTARFTFEGFLPVNKRERSERLSEVAELPHTLIFYEAPHKIKQTLKDMESALGGERSAALCRELTKLHEEIIRGTLSELARYYDELEPRGEYVVVVEGRKATAEKPTAEQAAELARGYAAGGEKLSEACKKAAKATGIPKQEIYRILMSEKDES